MNPLLLRTVAVQGHGHESVSVRIDGSQALQVFEAEKAGEHRGRLIRLKTNPAPHSGRLDSHSILNPPGRKYDDFRKLSHEAQICLKPDLRIKVVIKPQLPQTAERH